MATSTVDIPTDDRGRIRCYVGYHISASGKRTQHPFYFGRIDNEIDTKQYQNRLQRIKDVWAGVEARHDAQDLYGLLEPSKPVWRPDDLWVADNLAKGRYQIVVERSAGQDGHSYSIRLNLLAQTYPQAYFAPADAATYASGQIFWEKAAVSQLQSIGMAAGKILPHQTGFLHQALSQYRKSHEETYVDPTTKKLTANGVVRCEYVDHLLEHHPDMPLTDLDQEGCQQLLNYWRNRPISKKSKENKQISKSYAKHHKDELIAFFRWLHSSKQFAWRKPEDFDMLKTNILDIASERTDISALVVKTFEFEDLQLLYKHASKFDRLLLLLGINFAFRGAEAGTLQLQHLLDRHPHAKYLSQYCEFEVDPEDKWVIYCRGKNGHLGEFYVWKRTQKYLQWWLEERTRIVRKTGVKHPEVLLTKDGELLFRRTTGNKNNSQIFAKKWTELLDRVAAKTKRSLPRIPYGGLRDVATDLIRQAKINGAGEVAKTMTMHKTPLASDDLLSVYSNHPWGRLFMAQKEVEAKLDPWFEAVE
ncbi:MAG: hypothetical protein K8U03_17885 [Planctomycetia bacterium]|nr:hypothetical protein [Planctomycetia bacterium]